MKAPKTEETTETLVLEYDLQTLPTAQHKAGLAGLLMMIKSLELREIEPIPQVMEVTSTRVKIQFSIAELQTVIDDLYDAEIVEVESKNKWANATLKRMIEVEISSNGTTKTEKRFIYDMLQPKGSFLKNYYPLPNEPWIKLWRDALWSTLRGIPTTRNVYQQRAEKQPSSLAQDAWCKTQKSIVNRNKGKNGTEPISSALFLGAQDVNAEQVPFQGLPEQNLLLHFWTLPSRIFVPRLFTQDRKYENAGFVFAIPEPSNLEEFLQDIKITLESLKLETPSFRPREAIIDIPEEGGLEYLYSFVRYRIEQEEIKFSIAAVEIYHMEKQGNNIRCRSTQRIPSDPNILKEYNSFRNHFLNPFYKSRRVRNLLNGEPWYHGMEQYFNHLPLEYFVINEDTPRNLPFFGRDVNNTFHQIQTEYALMKGEVRMENSTQNEEQKSNALAVQIRRLIRSYARQRSEEKTNMKFDKFDSNEKGWKNLPKEFKEALSKVCMDAFLAMRSRRDKDFVEYFSGTICSVPQYMSNTEYLAVSHALLEEWETVKTLSMLALSAESSVAIVREEETNIQGE